MEEATRLLSDVYESPPEAGKMGDTWERLLHERGYKLQHTLGEGAYSKVKSAHSNRLSKTVAIKCINTQVAPKDFVEKFLPRELKTLPLLHHENIVRVYEILEASNGCVYIVMEAAQNGDMLRYIQQKGALPEMDIRRYFWQLCRAIEYCHSQNICHRDLKCENLLLGKDHRLLLTDFGFSRSVIYDNRGSVTLSSTFCGSAAYAAPEIIQGLPYDPRMHDMWSMGVILYIMACGHMPFDDSNVKKMLKIQLKNHIKFPPKHLARLSQQLQDLVRHLIQPDVSLRATIKSTMTHAFFDERTRPVAKRTSDDNNVARQIFEFLAGGTNHDEKVEQTRHQQPGCSHQKQISERNRRASYREAPESTSSGQPRNRAGGSGSCGCGSCGCSNASGNSDQRRHSTPPAAKRNRYK